MFICAVTYQDHVFEGLMLPADVTYQDQIFEGLMLPAEDKVLPLVLVLPLSFVPSES